VPPGKYSVVLRGQTQLAKKGDGNPKNVSALPVSVSSEPIKLTILPTEVAKLKVTPADAKGRPGESVTITIEIERLYEFDGPIKLEVVFPDGTKNVSVESVTVPAGKNTATITLKIANEAKATNLPKVIIKATARVGETKDIVSEGRLNLTVTK